MWLTPFAGNSRDITERRKENEVKLEEAIHFDLVTGLPNRAYFYEILKRSIHNNKRIKKEFALIYLDLDDLKISMFLSGTTWEINS